eukprot:TRINITY_DN22462_c0_g1_i1.p1 TRINITY_DN22462_c0_g1~~TRINITY_DN22462_c0_g1_i1.p1  ORF type:complete len:215 (-),score=60.51 TRINITY_DN22462_c0_g1_i1:480-1052(-)
MACPALSALSASSISARGFSSSSLFGDVSRISGPERQLGRCEERSLTITAAVKRWEKKECKPNSLPVRHKLHVKVGDTVKVITGGDKGKVTEVLKVYTHNSSVLVKDVNLKTKHVKGRAENESGQIVQVEAPIHSSNIMLYSKEKEVASRVGHKVLENGLKVRYLLKTGEVIDSPEQWKKVHKEKKETAK